MIPPRLSLHHITAAGADAFELAEIAAELGCADICIFTQQPRGANFPLVTREAAPELKARLDALGLGVLNLEVFPVGVSTDASRYAPSLETGARLGARRATVFVHGAEPERALETFRAFCDLAAGFNIRAGLEFAAFSATPSLGQALAFLEAADHANADLVLDCLHFFRTGGADAATLKRAAPRIGYLQLCDAARAAPADLMAEALGNRLPPGEGAVNFAPLLAALPSQAEISVEVPMQAARPELSPRERARIAIAAARKVLARFPLRRDIAL